MTNLPTPYQEFIAKSRYSRWDYDKKRRETWPEVVDRYTAFFKDRGQVDDELALKLGSAIKNLEVMPSMRCLMSAGKALERCNVAGFNPVVGDTPVVTKEFGNVPISTLVNRSATVLNIDGNWTLASFKSYQKQQVYRVNLRWNTTSFKDIGATANHRWILKDGSVVATENLRVGDKIPFVMAGKPAQDSDYILGLRHGLVYGDGTTTKACKRVKGYMIRLCSESRELLSFFEGYPVSYPKSTNGDPIVYLFDDFAATHSLKELPMGETDSYLLGFIRGWMAADGSVSKYGQVSLCAAKEGKEWLTTYSERIGFPIQRVYQQSAQTNYGLRKSESHIVFFSRSCITEEDILCSWKRERIKYADSQYTVTEVVKTESYEEVFCAEVPETNTFTLAGGLVTGNCSYIAIEDARCFDEMMYILMSGTGVGYSVEAEYVNKLPVIAESFHATDTTIVVGDSKVGWASAFRELLSLLYVGKIPKIDYSKVRPAGARLKIFGGRASGPEPLDDLFQFTIHMFKRAACRKLTTLEAHDLCCKIAEIVVVGGVRRCLPSDTLIHCFDGLKPIKSVNTGDFVLTDTGYREVLAQENVGVKATVIVHTQNGPFTMTPEHRVAVLIDTDGNYKWVAAKDLTNTDYLFFSKCGIAGAKTSLTPWAYEKPAHSTTCKDITIPELDTGMAWLFGNIHGDGYVYKSNRETSDSGGFVAVACADRWPGQHAKVVSELSRFGIPVVANKGTEEKCSKPRVASHQLAEYLSQFKQPKTSIDIPDFILKGSYAIRCAYIAGIFDADGSHANRPLLVAASVYPDYLRQLRAVLASLGIPAYIFLNRPAKGEWQNLWHLCIKGNYAISRFNTDIMPHSVKNLLIKERVKEQSGYIVPKEFTKQTSSMSWLTFEKHNGPRDFIPIRVNSIEESTETECYDIQVEGAQSFIAEGILVHNSALISMSDLNDDKMRVCKSGEWWKENKQRALANNSAVYNSKPDFDTFFKEWHSLYDSKSGERGIFSRIASQKQAAMNKRRDAYYQFGSNPCCEIILRSKQFCNLSTMIIRAEDTIETLLKKVELATILGTLQSTLTDFKYLRKEYFNNTSEECLLGVSMTGIMDHPVLNGSEGFERLQSYLTQLKDYAITVNKAWAEKLGVNQSTAITCCKPEGTVSQLTNTASGIHPRYSEYYIRTVRADKKDPLALFMKDKGFPCEEDVMKPDSTLVFAFPIQSPKACVTRDTFNCIEQLELWKMYQQHWCEHKPSITVYYKAEEFFKLGDWVYKNFDVLSGVSFLPHSDHVYKQAPYQEINEEKYLELKAEMDLLTIDWLEMAAYEQDDQTTSTQELACSNGSCEI